MQSEITNVVVPGTFFHDRLQLKRINLTAYQLKEYHYSEAIHHISPSDDHVALLQIGNYAGLQVDQQLTFQWAPLSIKKKINQSISNSNSYDYMKYERN